MADLGINLGTTQQSIVNGVNTTYLVMFFVMILVLFIGMIWFFLWFKSYNIKFRIWVVTGSNSLCIDDMAKVIRRKGEAPKWKLRNRKDYVPIPDDDSISINKKGKLCVEAFYTEKGQYIYKKNINNPNLDINNPLTTIDKEFYANEHIDAVQKYKKKNWMELLSTMAPLIGVIIIVIFMFAFWGQIVKPFMEMGDKIIAERQADREFYLEMHDIHRIIVGGTNNGTKSPNNIFAPS